MQLNCRSKVSKLDVLLLDANFATAKVVLGWKILGKPSMYM